MIVMETEMELDNSQGMTDYQKFGENTPTSMSFAYKW